MLKRILGGIVTATVVAVGSAITIAAPAQASQGPCATGYAGVQNRNGDNTCHKFTNDNYWDLPTGYVDYVNKFYNASGKRLCLIDWSSGSKAYVFVLSNNKTASVWGDGGEKADAIGNC
ncbi:hypothetical protein [Propionicimonas sp.]|uniref:hypothetical protein n=1 Tax=Propionicimonas sp. TaxID=1955623 RepID=UPI0039E4C6CA